METISPATFLGLCAAALFLLGVGALIPACVANRELNTLERYIRNFFFSIAGGFAALAALFGTFQAMDAKHAIVAILATVTMVAAFALPPLLRGKHRTELT